MFRVSTVVALGLEKSEVSSRIFRRKNQQDLMTDWIRERREREQVVLISDLRQWMVLAFTHRGHEEWNKFLLVNTEEGDRLGEMTCPVLYLL